jgi:GNAT superfamily N-acetyltransferase
VLLALAEGVLLALAEGVLPARQKKQKTFINLGASVMSIRFSLRRATKDDTPDIARLVKELAIYEKLGHLANATAHDFEQQLFCEHPAAHAMVAEADNQIIGIAIWHYNFSTFACAPGLYVEDIYVEPAHRGAGIGRAFFRALAKVAVEKSCARMEWAVLDWNTPSIKFYRSLGAIGMDEWTTQRLTRDKILALAEET